MENPSRSQLAMERARATLLQNYRQQPVVLERGQGTRVARVPRVASSLNPTQKTLLSGSQAASFRSPANTLSRSHLGIARRRAPSPVSCRRPARTSSSTVASPIQIVVIVLRSVWILEPCPSLAPWHGPPPHCRAISLSDCRGGIALDTRTRPW